MEHAKKLCCIVIMAISFQLSAQQKELIYDLRSCNDGFSILWNYYNSLDSELKDTQQQLRTNRRAIGRFSERAAIPNLPSIAEKLGANRQVFATILWRDMGKDKAFRFAVQRTLDVYGKIYYPFFVYEEYGAYPAGPKCEEQTLLQSIPPAPKLSTKTAESLLSQTPKIMHQLIAQEETPVERAETTVLLEVANAQQLCGWQQHYGESVIVPAQQLPGSSAWRLRDQTNLPYNLTRLKLYLWGKRPYPMAYTSYDGKDYVILASFENGYRLQYLPRDTENIQITGTVMFWLAPVDEIPAELPPANEPKYDCSN